MKTVESQYPLVGITVMVFDYNRLTPYPRNVLLGMRKGSHGENEYAFPGGKLELGESFTQCAERECKEEAGITIFDTNFLRLLNFRAYGKHFVDIAFTAFTKDKPVVMEKDKCYGWSWYPMGEIPEPRFHGVDSCLQAYYSGQNFFE
jgi:8-oxo-dGTP diphosphatase